VEKYGLSMEELKGQHTELLPDRIEMKKCCRRRRGRRFVQDCDAGFSMVGELTFIGAPVTTANCGVFIQ
jgi:hypothetical protein